MEGERGRDEWVFVVWEMEADGVLGDVSMAGLGRMGLAQVCEVDRLAVCLSLSVCILGPLPGHVYVWMRACVLGSSEGKGERKPGIRHADEITIKNHNGISMGTKIFVWTKHQLSSL